MLIGQLVNFYLEFHLKGRSSHRNCCRVNDTLLKPLHEIDADLLDRITLLTWFSTLKSRPSQAIKARCILRAASRWGAMQGFCRGDLTMGLSVPRAGQRSTTISTEGWAKLRPYLRRESLRDRTYFYTIYLTGCRPGEARVMRWEDVDLTASLWTQRTSKNGRAHLVPLPAPLVAMLRDVRTTAPHDAWVFTGKEGDQPIHRTAMQHVWERIRSAAGFRQVTMHDLRRSVATDLLNQGESIGVVQGALNHRSLSETQKYAYLATDTLRRALNKRAEQVDALMRPCEAVPDPPPPPLFRAHG